MILSCLVYLAALIFAGGSAIRAVRYARTPVPLRWELYPIPAGAAGQVRYTVLEVLLLRGLWAHNRNLWYRTYPFHMGIYLCAAALLSMAVGAGRVANAVSLIGLCLLFAGSCALLEARITDPALQLYTSPMDLLNLAWFALLAAIQLTAFVVHDVAPAAAWRAVLTFQPVRPLAGIGVVLAALMAAYIPFTHMSHFIAKYFAYHKVLWDDSPSDRVAAQLQYTPRWAAPHVGADGSKTWADVATANPAPEKKR